MMNTGKLREEGLCKKKFWKSILNTHPVKYFILKKTDGLNLEFEQTELGINEIGKE